MTTLNLYSVSKDIMLQDDATHLCVFDSQNNLVADYDLCTGLRLVQDDDNLTIYINDIDLVPGLWTLFVTTVDKNFSSEKTRIDGVKEGSIVPRDFQSDSPWNGCGVGPRVPLPERETRLSICAECPLLNAATMTCTVSNKLVLDATTREDQYCPEDKWGDKQKVLDSISQFAFENGLVTLPQGEFIDTDDQSAFEDELANYLEELQ